MGEGGREVEGKREVRETHIRCLLHVPRQIRAGTKTSTQVCALEGELIPRPFGAQASALTIYHTGHGYKPFEAYSGGGRGEGKG